MILVTGGSGYIGSHIINLLNSKRYKTVVLDICKNEDIKPTIFYSGDIRNKTDLKNLFESYNIDLVIHCAAKKDVSESILNPMDYYHTNVEGTRLLLETMKENNVDKIIFSSTAAMYNDGISKETDIPNPKTPYASSKLTCEDMIRYSGLKYVIFRFFNVAGHDKKGVMLIQRIKQHEKITIYGNDYDTRDGTCIRDYIHVEDIANAHIKAIEYLETNEKGLFNLGTNNGYTIKEICDKANIQYEIGKRRESDVIISIADNTKAKEILGWKPEKTLEDILKEEQYDSK